MLLMLLPSSLKYNQKMSVSMAVITSLVCAVEEARKTSLIFTNNQFHMMW